MSLRKSFAAALKLLRTQRGFSQVEISKTVVQSHVSQLESALTTATVDVSYELACALSIQPMTLFTLTLAGHEQKTGRQMLLDCLAELEKLDLADTLLPDEPPAKMTPAMVEARKKWVAVQEMKAQGLTQAEVRKRLALPEPTVRRLWNREWAGD
ncbi:MULTISPECIES: helix-turn-helix domain-containing protein [Pseudomonas]|uniref:helix-turn-helix domain-containing protein n=1 Tax=Pseudomonas TaxID=286 RepID=UPI00098E962D|nr:helix-turn-helix transcriptional regulator [Pseudomonas azotoformans]AQT94976.1 transcriptional regulator [Pseudomonas azotoformans]UMY47084.1 helix-turn-helix domain-containing protein [Pseudomonas azotoformans]